MAPDDLVPEADRLEQETPAERDVRDVRDVRPGGIPPDAPDADVLEQALPLADEQGHAPLDAERTEPLPDEDWAGTGA